MTPRWTKAASEHSSMGRGATYDFCALPCTRSIRLDDRMTPGDAGLAHEHWKKFYSPEEVDEILGATTTTMLVSGNYPIHVRLYERDPTAPTVIMAPPMLPYGLLLARLQL